MEIREVELAQLKPWEKNPRVNDHAVAAVARSILEFGFNVPILCDEEMTIIAGHTRLKAAKQLGIARVPVIVLPLTGAQRRAFAVADNKVAEIADWDFPALRGILEELKSEEIDLSSLGYSESELQALLEPEKDFDWSAFKDYFATCQEGGFTLVPVRVPVAAKDAVKSAIRAYASEHAMSDKDPSLLAGKVLAALLGVTL
jgi:site-specific DNA-methyltransferase (adenine-specific)